MLDSVFNKCHSTTPHVEVYIALHDYLTFLTTTVKTSLKEGTLAGLHQFGRESIVNHDSESVCTQPSTALSS